MQRFKHILVYFQPDQSNSWVAERAVNLAQINQASVTFVGSYSPGRIPEKILGKRESTRLQNFLSKAKRSELEHAAQYHAKPGVGIRTKVLAGTAFVEIIKLIKRDRDEIVMLEADRKGLLHQSFFGSTAMHLLRKCPCPVWIFKPAQKKKFRHILVAVDAATDDPVEQRLNIKLLEISSSLCENDAAKLHVVHCWEAYGERYMRGSRPGTSDSDVDAYVKICKKAQRNTLMALLDEMKWNRSQYTLHFIKGSPGLIIPKLAKQNGIELIIMGTVARTGLSGFIVGNTAEQVLSTVGCSVLAVKPDGFVSPLHQDSRS